MPLMVVGPLAVRVHAVGGARPPTTCLTRVSVGAIAVLVIVHSACSPSVRVMCVPSLWVPPVQSQSLAVQPGSTDSLSVYVPTATGAFVTLGSPTEPPIGVGPVAVSSHV